MKVWRILFCFLLIIFSGCSRSINIDADSINSINEDFLSDDNKEIVDDDKAGEEIDEEETNSLSDDGDGGYGKNEGLEIDLKGELDLPEGYPSSVVPLYEPERIGLVNRFEINTGGIGFEVQYTSEASLEKVHEYYVGLLEGSEHFMDMDMNGSYSIGCYKDKYGITVTISESSVNPENTSVTIGIEEVVD